LLKLAYWLELPATSKETRVDPIFSAAPTAKETPTGAREIL